MNNKVFWEKYFRTYDVLNKAIPYQKLMEDLIRVYEPKRGDLIFDAGSGTGNLCIRLKECGSKRVQLACQKDLGSLRLPARSIPGG